MKASSAGLEGWKNMTMNQHEQAHHQKLKDMPDDQEKVEKAVQETLD